MKISIRKISSIIKTTKLFMREKYALLLLFSLFIVTSTLFTTLVESNNRLIRQVMDHGEDEVISANLLMNLITTGNLQEEIQIERTLLEEECSIRGYQFSRQIKN